MNELSERLYTIQNDKYHYYTGHLSNGNQVLMLSSVEPPVVAGLPRVEFDAAGNVVAAYTKDHLPPASMPPPLFSPGTIVVKSFFIPEMWFGVQELPSYHLEFLDEPENATEEERLEYPDEIAQWRAEGDFVVWVNEEYFLNKEGELVSS